MKTTGKKVIAGLLALAVLFTTSFTAFAADETTVSQEPGIGVEQANATPQPELPAEPTLEPGTDSTAAPEPSIEPPEEPEATMEPDPQATAQPETTIGPEAGPAPTPDESQMPEQDTAQETLAPEEQIPPETEEEPLFPGLPEHYALSRAQLESKERLADALTGLQDMAEGRDCVPGEVYFLCDTEQEAQLYAQAYGGTLKSYSLGVGVLELPEQITVKQAVRAAADEQEVELPPVSPNFYYYPLTESQENDLPAEETAAAAEQERHALLSVDDPMLRPENLRYQWQHQVLGSAVAWASGYRGQGVKVAVLDSGIYPHEDLVVTANYNAVRGSAEAPYGTDNHGTHVAGIIGAKNNNGKGGSGIAPDAMLYNVRVFDEAVPSGSGTSATILRGLNKAIEWNCDIINLSLGGTFYDALQEIKIDEATGRGIAVFAAAGNDGSMTACYPGTYANTICVAATETNHGRAYFSNYGAWVDMAAPGVEIFSTTFRSNNTGMHSDYLPMSGTSQACPMAAGAAAVLLSAAPAALRDKNGNPLTGQARVKALEKLMQTGATKTTGASIGKGIVSLTRALGLTTNMAAPNKPTLSHKAGVYPVKEIEVSLTAQTGMEIYYTTDGKAPAYKNGAVTNGVLYTGPITLSGLVNGKAAGKQTLKAIAVNGLGMASAVTSATYTFKPAVETIAIAGLQTLPAGRSLSLKAVVEPSYAANKTVSWSISGDPKASGVSISASGTVTAKKTAVPGEYTVTAVARDGLGARQTYQVRVIPAPRIQKIAFSKKSVAMVRGGADATQDLSGLLQLTATGEGVLTATDLAWSSSKPAVARVSPEGVVTALGAGSAVITALAGDGSGKKASVTVTVTQQVTELRLTGSSVVARGKSITLKATVLPANVKNKKIVWSISGDSKLTGVSVAGGRVTAKKDAVAGIYIVTAAAADGSGTIEHYEVKVTQGPITKLTLSTARLNLFRVEGKGGGATGAVLALRTEGPFDADAIEVQNSAPGIVNAVCEGRVLTVEATGKSTGTAVITVKAMDGSNKSARCTVTVVNPASNLTVSPAAGRLPELGRGKSLRLSAVLETEYGPLAASAKKIQWSSSDPSIATVSSSGVVTAKAGYLDGGTAVITAATTDGSNLSVTYNVNTYEPIRSLRIGQPERIEAARGVYVYACQIYYNGYIYGDSIFGIMPEVAVEVSNSAIASAQTTQTPLATSYGQLFIFPNQSGNVKIKVKAMDGSNVSASISLRIA